MAETALAGVTLRTGVPGAQVGLRLDPEGSPEAAVNVAQLLGVERLPATGAIAATRALRVLGLGPDGWLVVAHEREAGELAGELEDAGGDALVTAVDLSANRVALELSGPHASDVLAHGCSLDLRPRSFPPGACAQTLVARVQVVIERSALDAFTLRVRPSFAPYLVAWLADAAAEYAPGPAR